ncbi:MAG TPA: sodium-dependent transporter [Cyclobacteriaceae bacterium]|nr:sodium-dependent transporter [Cyclobacteriaceae bacterium]HRJ81195.1 sodium-dependent transporter [Cyclobacteriaceae bacterium]
MSIQASENRGQWGSKFGFIMAAAGSAVGLGNIWRFPYITGQNGGGAFVFVYILCVLLVGLPLLYNETALGRLTGKNTVGAFKDTGANKFWQITAGFLALSVSFFVLSYYGVIAGWTIGYIISEFTDFIKDFETFRSNALYVIPFFALFMVITVYIVQAGVSGGIEKASKILMPILFILIVLVIFRSITLPGAMEGVKYYLTPDFSKINGNTILAALGQAFFSLSIGWGIMITYGSYLPKSNNIISSGLWVGSMDTLVALLGGLMIFPAVFAFGKDPAGGTTLVFQVLPEIFNAMPAGGNIVGALFFLLLCIAALTSSISMIEVPASYLIDEKKWSRKKAAWIIGILAFLIGIPSALSGGASRFFTDMSINFFGSSKTGFLDIMDALFGTLFIVIVCLMTALYVGWVLKPQKVSEEIGLGSPFYHKKLVFGISPSQMWIFFIKFICPIVILLVLLATIGVIKADV